jgi:hypothetical protein
MLEVSYIPRRRPIVILILEKAESLRSEILSLAVLILGVTQKEFWIATGANEDISFSNSLARPCAFDLHAMAKPPHKPSLFETEGMKSR